MTAPRKVNFHLHAQELSDIAAQKASGAKDSVTGTGRDVYDGIADRLTTAHKTATQQLQDTRKAAEQQWTGAHTAWQKATGQHRTTSQKAWDKAQVHLLALLLVQSSYTAWWLNATVPLLEAYYLHAALRKHSQEKALLMSVFPIVQELRAEINKQLLTAENQLESAYISAKASAETKWKQMHGEL